MPKTKKALKFIAVLALLCMAAGCMGGVPSIFGSSVDIGVLWRFVFIREELLTITCRNRFQLDSLYKLLLYTESNL